MTRRPAFRIGLTRITPSTRELAGPIGTATMEPRVMQVLLALHDAGGAVVPREQLIRDCWDNRFVGEDALNRAIGEVRRVARIVAGDGFTVVTVPRTGYRLVTTILSADHSPEDDVDAIGTAAPMLARAGSRRTLVAAGLAGVVGLTAWRLWPHDGAVARVAALLAAADRRMRDDLPEPARGAVALLREASTLQLGNPVILGRLAVANALAADFADPVSKPGFVGDCQTAASLAMRPDQRQPDAMAAPPCSSPNSAIG